jgi:hypothetical protein
MKQMSQGQKYIYEIIVLTSVQASGCQCVQVYHHDISGAAGAARAPCLGKTAAAAAFYFAKSR